LGDVESSQSVACHRRDLLRRESVASDPNVCVTAPLGYV
jgi:hypothetical protein